MPDETYRRTTRNSGKGLEKFLGDLQLAVMEVIWEGQPVSVSDVLNTLNQQNRELAYTTVMTIMSRLAEKGWLVSEKRGRAFFYRAVHSREEAEVGAVGEVVRAVIHAFRRSAALLVTLGFVVMVGRVCRCVVMLVTAVFVAHLSCTLLRLFMLMSGCCRI